MAKKKKTEGERRDLLEKHILEFIAKKDVNHRFTNFDLVNNQGDKGYLKEVIGADLTKEDRNLTQEILLDLEEKGEIVHLGSVFWQKL